MKRCHIVLPYLNIERTIAFTFAFCRRETLPWKWCAVCSKSAFRRKCTRLRTTPPRPSSAMATEISLCSRPGIAYPSTRRAFFVRLFLSFPSWSQERTVRYYRPRNGVVQPERRRKRERERKNSATENIYGQMVDKITANLHPMVGFCQTFVFF